MSPDGSAVVADESPDDQAQRRDGAADTGSTRGRSAGPEAGGRRRTARWGGAAALAVVLGGLGVVLGQPAVLLLSAVGVACAGYAASRTPPGVDLSVERHLACERPDAGQAVEVSVAVTNEGAATLWDLRLVDRVPPGLSVAEGSPRLGTTLRPGESTTLEYAVEATRGAHEFGPVDVVARDLAGATERSGTVASRAVLRCVPPLGGRTQLPPESASTRFAGQVDTDAGGEGVEFYATREYRPGDPLGRIDWNRHARTRELATLLFRQERAATVVLVVDARPSAFRAPAPTAASAVERSVEASGALFDALTGSGNRVGIAALGPRECWLPPGAGAGHRERARRLLATHPAFGREPPEETVVPRRQFADLHGRVPGDAQIVAFTPATDDYVASGLRWLRAHGHPVSVVSPDVTVDDDHARRLAAVERQVRLNGLREAELRVVDWDPSEPMSVAIERAGQRWSR